MKNPEIDQNIVSQKKYSRKYKSEITLHAFKLGKGWIPKKVYASKAFLTVTFTHMANIVLQEDLKELE